jgi:tetratricopeptide (TPR) repeat protein
MKPLGWLALCLPVAALSQTPSKEEQAMKLYEEAEAYYKLQDWSKALELYEAAYLLSPQPELLFNIGQCYRQLGKYEQSLRSYRTYLREVPDDINREQIEQLIAVTEQQARDASSQPTTMVASTQATSNPSSTSEPTKSPPPKDPRWPLWASATGATAGLALGAIALSARLRAEEAFIDGDAPAFSKSAKRAQTISISADATMLAGLGLGLYASSSTPMQRSHLLFYSVAGISAASALTCSLVGFSAARRSNDVLDDTSARFLSARALAFGAAADSLWISAALWAGLGLLSQRRHLNERAQVSVGARSAQVSVNF